MASRKFYNDMISNLVEHPARLLDEAQKATLKRSLGTLGSRARANEVLAGLTGLADFFESDAEWKAFREFIASDSADSMRETAREYGDFQTPLDLAKRVCRQLSKLGYAPSLLVEPTCGRGNFILAALETFPSIQKVFGLEIQEQYVAECKSNLLAHLLNQPHLKREIHIVQGNIFHNESMADFLRGNADQVLVLGNPPWVTNS